MTPKKKAKVLYYIDEAIILLVTFLSVLLSEAVETYALKGSDVELPQMNIAVIIVAGLASIVSYSFIHKTFKYKETDKAPRVKRIATAILQGIAWKTVVGWGK